MFQTEKDFIQWLLESVKSSDTICNLYDKICTPITDTDTRYFDNGILIAVATVINGSPYVYCLNFDDKENIKNTEVLIKGMMADIEQYD